MTTITSRPYAGASDLPRLITFARQQLIRRAPGLTYLHPGDLTWQLYLASKEMPYDDIRLWFEGEALVAYAIFEAPLHSGFDLIDGRPGGPGLTSAILAWIEGRRRDVFRADEQIPLAYSALGARSVATNCLESDFQRAKTLLALGYERTSLHQVRYSRSLAEPIHGAALPAGYQVRYTADADVEARAELHRQAWSIWGPSSFSANRYRRLRVSPGYREDLDIVVESESGQLVSYCVCWADEASGIAIFEPVGTHPGFVRQGLGRAAIHEGLRRLRAMGMHTALIGTSSVNTPALALYPSCGFSFVEREDSWAKPVV